MDESIGLLSNQRKFPISKTKKIILIISLFLLITGILAVIIIQVSQVYEETPNSNPFQSLQGFCKDVNKIPKVEYLQRQNRIMNYFQSSEVTALILEPGANMEYFTGIRWSLSERPFLYLMLANQSSFWICPSFEVRRAVELIGNATIWFWEEDESPYELVGKALGYEESNNQSNLLALDHEIRYFIVDKLLELYSYKGLRVRSGKDEIIQLRTIKSKNEVTILDCANRATKRAIKLVATQITEGMTESNVASMLEDALSTAGLTNLWWLVLFGPDASFPHGNQQERTIKQGELILIDTGGTLYGYKSDISRTFPFGQVSEELRFAWNIVKEAQNVAFHALAPNVSCSIPEELARQVVINSGYGPDYKYFTHRLGHGIGLQGHEDPYLVRGNNNTLLQPGNTFSIEPGIYVPDKFGIRLEDIAMITETGYLVFGPLSASIDDPFAGH